MPIPAQSGHFSTFSAAFVASRTGWFSPRVAAARAV
jgi:hypothetical protein